jgi:hypothetical protein
LKIDDFNKTTCCELEDYKTLKLSTAYDD